MANIKAKKKNIKRIAFQSARNTHTKSKLKTLHKNVLGAEEGDKKAHAQKYISALDKAVKHGIIHKNKASRHKSRMAKHLFGQSA